MSNTPLVSVIIPCYNSAAYLRETIDCALGQDYQNKEVIVVDDGSTDNSAAIMDEYHGRIRVIRQKNMGLSAARNTGINAADGAYLAFLDADDYWTPDFLSEMSGALSNNPDGIAYCGWQNIGLPGNKGLPFTPPDYESDPDKIKLLFAHPRWPVHASLVPKALAQGVGGFNPQLKSCEDFDFWLKTALNVRLTCAPKVMAFYRHHPGQMTKRRAENTLYQLQVQTHHLAHNPYLNAPSMRESLRLIMTKELHRKAFDCYWDRDIACARVLFQQLLRTSWVKPSELKYVLPALLPLPLYQWLVNRMEKKPNEQAGNS